MGVKIFDGETDDLGGGTLQRNEDQEKALEDNAGKKKTKDIANLMKSLQADFPFVQLLAQTMPPFPWHQGGRAFHNCLAQKSSILKYIEDSGLRICLDISHTALAANYFKFDFYKLIEELVHETSHLHIADASKSNQEGQQIGEGDLDFSRLLKVYNNTPNAYTFIPEIWQGHLNEGEGFHKALSLIDDII